MNFFIKYKIHFLGLLIVIFLDNKDLFFRKPERYSTFHSISIYWKPEDGSIENECLVHFRAENEKYWRRGKSLWVDPNNHIEYPNRSHEYRGSIVNLIPGTMYEILLVLKETGTKVKFF